MSEEYSKIAQEIIKLIEQVPIKRYGDINLVLAKELGLMLIEAKEKTLPVQMKDISANIKNFTFKELQGLTKILKGELERRKI